MNIYGVCDPITDELRYIGCTKSRLNIRLNNHLAVAKRRKTGGQMRTWLLGLTARPKIFLIEETNTPADEGFYIEYFSAIGADLLNEMTPNGRSWTRRDGLNNRVSAKLAGRKKSASHVAKVAASNRGKHFGPLSPEHKRHISEALRRRYAH